MQTFKLYVGTSNNDIRLLRFLRDNIPIVNQMGVRVSITHIKKSNMNADLVEALHKKGISRLPVLIADRKKFVGVKRITGLFRNNISNFGQMNNPMGAMGGMGGMGGPGAMGDGGPATDTVESYMSSIMAEGEDDPMNDDQDDMMRKYADATTGRTPPSNEPKHHRASAPDDSFETSNYNDVMSGDPSSTRPDDDNISVMGSLSQTTGADSLDMQMENAYWTNQSTSESVLDF